MRRIIAKCGDRDIYIISPLPRYINAICCGLPTHCMHRSIPDSGLKIACDLFRLRSFFSKRLEDLPRCKVVAAGDLLVGEPGAAPSDIFAATSDWGAVHGPNASYTRMGLNFLDLMKAKNDGTAPPSRKRFRSDSFRSTSPMGRERTDTGTSSVVTVLNPSRSFVGASTHSYIRGRGNRVGRRPYARGRGGGGRGGRRWR